MTATEKKSSKPTNGLGRTVRVLLADDHNLVRAGIRTLVEKIPGVIVAGEASDGRELLALIKEETPDLVLLDISMPGLNGLETLARIQKEFRDVRVIVLSMHHASEYVWQALSSGAAGYLLKRSGVSELEPAMKSVLAGKVYLSPDIAKRMLKEGPRRESNGVAPLQRLTARQREVLQLMAEGETTKGIAMILKLSNKTVEYHRAQLMECLNIFDVPGLVRFALRSGLVSEEN